MAIEEMVTELPTVTIAQLSDIVMAVQGYVSPSALGTSVQETWQQVYTLFQSQTVQFYPGNPNGNLAGSTYQFCWDTTDTLLYICTMTGTISTAVWTQITNNSSGSNWVSVTTTPFAMATNQGYINNNAGAAVLTLPTTAKVGDTLRLMGNGAGGWTISYTTGQSIIIGSSTSTVTTGSVASTNRYDSLSLICVVANTQWQANVPPQGNLTIV